MTQSCDPNWARALCESQQNGEIVEWFVGQDNPTPGVLNTATPF